MLDPSEVAAVMNPTVEGSAVAVVVNSIVVVNGLALLVYSQS